MRENRAPGGERHMISDEMMISEHCPSSQQSQQRPKRVTVTSLLERPYYGEVGDED